MAVEYGVKHMGVNMTASTQDVLRVALRKRYRAQLSLAAWRGYANLVLDRTKYVGSGKACIYNAQIRLDMLCRGDACEHVGMRTAHKSDVPARDAFPNG